MGKHSARSQRYRLAQEQNRPTQNVYLPTKHALPLSRNEI